MDHIFVIIAIIQHKNLKNIAIAHIKKNAYIIYFQHINKHKAKKTMNKFDLTGKIGNSYCNN